MGKKDAAGPLSDEERGLIKELAETARQIKEQEDLYGETADMVDIAIERAMEDLADEIDAEDDQTNEEFVLSDQPEIMAADPTSIVSMVTEVVMTRWLNVSDLGRVEDVVMLSTPDGEEIVTLDTAYAEDRGAVDMILAMYFFGVVEE